MLDRRGFLRMLAAVAATAALPVPKFVLAESGIVVPQMPVELGSIRALTSYDIERDCQVCRLDAFNRRLEQQFYVDFRIELGRSVQATRDNYLDARKPAEEALRNMIEQQGWRADDMQALPVPFGYREPVWMRQNV